MQFYVRIFLFIFAAFSASVCAKAEKSDEEILSYADIARGGGLPGLQWEVDVESILKQEKKENIKLKVSAASENWVAEFTSPGNVTGNKLLQVGENMWFTKRGLRKPVPISQRQRLTGSASNGDIASTNYVDDYKASRLADQVVGGRPAYVFDLEARTSKVTYDKIKYWVDKETGLGVKAEFYTSAGRLLKTASFKYDNRITVGEKPFPFISSMTIEDAINESQYSVLKYGNIEVKSIPAAKFRL